MTRIEVKAKCIYRAHLQRFVLLNVLYKQTGIHSIYIQENIIKLIKVKVNINNINEAPLTMYLFFITGDVLEKFNCAFVYM